MNKDILVATCGTSVLTNAREIKAEVLGERRYSQMTEEEGNLIKEKVLSKLSDKEANERCCGAELNSIYHLIEKGEFLKKEIHLIVSDSIDGKLAGEIIKTLLLEKLNIDKIEVITIDDLNIGNEHKFAKKGLRNLAKKVTKLICDNGAENIVLSPIGGLKAEIIIVALIGQVFGIPCYYLYENSTNIVEILPLPVSIDLEFLKNNVGIISKIYKEQIVVKQEIESYLKANPNLRNILEEEKIDNDICYALSPLGITGYEKLFSETQRLLPRKAKEEEKLRELQFKSREPNADRVRTNSAFQKIIKEIIDIDYVTKVILNYYNPKNKGNIIDITKSSNKTEGRVLKLKYNCNDGMVEVLIFLTEQEEDKVDAARIDIYSKIS